MPELPEVETICRSLSKAILNIPIIKVDIRCFRLRYPIPHELPSYLQNLYFTKIVRRGKYLLLLTTHGALIVHLGMSGRLLVLPKSELAHKHEHVTFTFANGLSLRFVDPRRFGAILWTTDHDYFSHPLLKKLGVEPLSKGFTTDYLYRTSQSRHICIKQMIMDATVVVGVGNIYANEALFYSGINPLRKAASMTKQDCQRLVVAIKKVLRRAIKCGGTTIRDFVSGDGSLGYFVQQLQVYGRDNQSCLKCGKKIKSTRLGQRSTFYCPHCQR